MRLTIELEARPEGGWRATIPTLEGVVAEATSEEMACHNVIGQALSLLAAILLRQQRPVEALALYERAVASNPTDVTSIVGLGVALASSGQLDEAIAAFRRALLQDPGNTHAQQNLARALAMKQDGHGP